MRFKRTCLRSYGVLRLIILLLMFPALTAIAGCQESRRPSRYLVPQGYVGWINIYFDVKDASPVTIEEDHYLFRIPSSGELKTSSSMAAGTAFDDYYYYDESDNRKQLESTGWDEGGMVWAESYGNDTEGRKYERFFVGTEEQLRNSGFKMDKQVGPIPR
jgi:hypothetical protein